MRHILESAEGWRRRGWAVLFGICATASLPPFYVLPLLVPAFAGLFLLVHTAASRRQAFLDGWWWGLGHFVTGLYWMCISLYVDPAKFAWLTPFALFGVPSVLAIYTGVVTLALYCIGGTRHEARGTKLIVVFAGLWVIAEYARAHLFTGFPWNLIGYTWTVSDATLQFASVVGIYGLSWLTVIVATLPALFWLRDPAAAKAISVSIIILVSMVIFGCWRLHAYPTRYTAITLRVVQANVPEKSEPTPTSELEGLKKAAVLTRSPGLDKAQIVVWPEAAVPFFMESGSTLARDLGDLLPKDSLLLTGGVRGKNNKEWQAWNSLFVLNREGQIMAVYDKHHLVPFGEFIPFRGILRVENIAGGIGDFSRGPGPATLSIGGYPAFSPLICYEAIFPDETTDNTHRAKWLLNVTNDAWFGTSSGPWQHLEMARARAVEQGLPLVRAANTGVSAVFDPLGRLLKRLPLGEEGIIDVNLPQDVQNTIIGRYSYSPAFFIIVLSIIIIFTL